MCLKVKENSNYFLKNSPSWRFSRCDLDSEYSITNAKEDIYKKLSAFESMTFDEIFNKNRHKNHPISDKSKLSKWAKNKLKYLKINEYADIYSLKLEDDMRIYGIIEADIFYILWYAPKHEIYPSNKQ